MRTLAQFIFLALCFCANAQSSNLIVFSEDGDSFTLFVNGARQNAAPQTRVKATDITGDGCKVKVVFQDVSLPEFSKYVILESGQEVTFGIKKNKKGAIVLRLVSTSEKNNEPVDPAFGKSNHDKRSENQPNSSTDSNQTNRITSTSSSQLETDNASMNVSVSGDENAGNMNVSVNANDQIGSKSGKSRGNGNTGENVSMNVSVNGDDSNASMSVSMNASQGKNQGNSKSNNGNRNGQQKNGNNGNHYGQYKNKPGFCSGKGLNGQDMVKIKYDIQQKYLDAARGDMIKKIAVDNCIHSSQAAELIKLLSLDRPRYEVGMFVFQHIYDPSEYYIVIDLIGDISLKQKLEDYVLDYLKSSEPTASSGSNSGDASTTSSSSSSSQSSSNSTPAPANGNIVININNAPVNTNEINTTSTTTTSRTTTTSNTEGSCSLSDSQYDDIVSSINSKPHSDTKMTVAKQALKNRCMTVRQVIGFAKLFVHEDDKLEFAKFAYKYTSNKSDYYKVADVFSNSFTIDELNDFLDSN